MAECLMLASDPPQDDPQKIRHQPIAATLAIGAVFGYLAARREAIDAAADGTQEPPYPADLLNELAEAIAAIAVSDPPLSTSRSAQASEALDSYSAEVGRENVPALVDKAIAELGSGQ